MTCLTRGHRTRHKRGTNDKDGEARSETQGSLGDGGVLLTDLFPYPGINAFLAHVHMSTANWVGSTPI